MHQLWLVLHEKINPWIYNSICNFGQFRMPVQTKVCFKNNLFTIGFLKIRNSKNRILKRCPKIWNSYWNTAQSGIPGRSWDKLVRFSAMELRAGTEIDHVFNMWHILTRDVDLFENDIGRRLFVWSIYFRRP